MERRSASKIRWWSLVFTAAMVAVACGGGGAETGGGEAGQMPEVTISALSGGLTAVAAKAIEVNDFDEANGWVGRFEFKDPDASGQFFLQRRSDIAFDFDAIGAAIARSQGLDVTVFYPVLNNNNCIVVRGDAPYQSPADLIGKQVGHFGADSGTTTSFTIVLNEWYGINPLEQYKLVETDPATLVEFLANGEVEAIFDFVPHVSRALAQFGGRCLFGPLNKELERLSGGEVVSHLSAMAAYEDFIRENPDTVQAVIDAWNDAYAWLTEDPSRITEEPFRSLLGQDDPAVLELIQEQVTSVPLFANDWSPEVRAGVERWIDLAAEQGVLIEENPGGVVSTVDDFR